MGTRLHAGRSRGSIPDGLIGILHWHYPPGLTLALGSDQPLRETRTRNISSGVKAAGVEWWRRNRIHLSIFFKSDSPTLLETSGPVQVAEHDILGSRNGVLKI